MLVFMIAALALAPEYLTEIKGDPVEASGNAAAIARRGETCMGRLLSAGVEGGELIVTRDLDAGVLVSRNSVEYRDHLVPWKVRSRVTFEARDGRFRITHGNIERFNDGGFSPGWGPVGIWFGSGAGKVRDVLAAQTAEIQTCVTSSSEDW